MKTSLFRLLGRASIGCCGFGAALMLSHDACSQDVIAPLGSPTAEAARATPSASPGVHDVVKMLDAKVDPGVVVAYVESSQVAYNPSADEIVALKNHGVPDDVIKAMLVRGTELRNQGAQAPAPVASQQQPGDYNSGAPYAAPLTPEYNYDAGMPSAYASYSYGWPYGPYGYPYGCNYWWYNFGCCFAFYAPFYWGWYAGCYPYWNYHCGHYAGPWYHHNYWAGHYGGAGHWGAWGHSAHAANSFAGAHSARTVASARSTQSAMRAPSSQSAGAFGTRAGAGGAQGTRTPATAGAAATHAAGAPAATRTLSGQGTHSVNGATGNQMRPAPGGGRSMSVTRSSMVQGPQQTYRSYSYSGTTANNGYRSSPWSSYSPSGGARTGSYATRPGMSTSAFASRGGSYGSFHTYGGGGGYGGYHGGSFAGNSGGYHGGAVGGGGGFHGGGGGGFHGGGGGGGGHR